MWIFWRIDTKVTLLERRRLMFLSANLYVFRFFIHQVSRNLFCFPVSRTSSCILKFRNLFFAISFYSIYIAFSCFIRFHIVVLYKYWFWDSGQFYFSCTDERWERTCGEYTEHRDQYFPVNQRWKCSYAAYGGFLLHYTAGGTSFLSLPPPPPVCHVLVHTDQTDAFSCMNFRTSDQTTRPLEDHNPLIRSCQLEM